jgi:hypothetical protein
MAAAPQPVGDLRRPDRVHDGGARLLRALVVRGLPDEALGVAAAVCREMDTRQAEHDETRFTSLFTTKRAAPQRRPAPRGLRK